MSQGSFVRPTSLEDALRLLGQRAATRPIAGGQSLVPALRRIGNQRKEVLVGIDQLDGLKGIRAADNRLHIGAAETHNSIASSQIVQSEIPALAGLVKSIGDAQVRNRGTLGGALVSNFLHTDYAAPIYGLNSRIHTSSRTLAPSEFASESGAPFIARDELVVSVSFEIPSRAVYVRLPHPAGGYADLGVFCAVDWESSIKICLIGSDFAPVQLDLAAGSSLGMAADSLRKAANLSAHRSARLRRLLKQAESRL